MNPRSRRTAARLRPQVLGSPWGNGRRWRLNKRISCALLIVTLLVPSMVASSVQGAFPGANGMIVVWKGARGHGDGHYGHELYTVSPDGSNFVRLTHSDDSIWNTQATWSPDGQLVAYREKRSHPGDSYRIVVIDLKGNEVDAIAAPNGGFLSGPSWSPDGTKLVYARAGNIAVHEIGGSQPDRLITSGKPQESLPVWSPDGTKLAFLRYIRDDFRLTVARIDLSREQALTDAATMTPPQKSDWCPDWHPTKNRLVVTRRGGSLKSDEIVVINADTGVNRRLTDDRSASDWCPGFSPDGRDVVWERTVFKEYGYGIASNKLVRMRLSTGERTTVVASRQYLSEPDWQPLNEVP